MLGVIHRDHEGPGLLASWLESVEPEVISVEFSQYGLLFRQRYGQYYRAKIEESTAVLERAEGECVKAALTDYFSLPYEYTVPEEYGSRRSVPVYLVDVDFFSYQKLKEVENLVSSANVSKLRAGDGNNGVAAERTLARLALQKNLAVASYDEEMYIRDRCMSDRISLLARYHKGKRFLHICGWRHLKDPCGLYENLKPVKAFIYDTAFCI